jgi:hypothetical protein
VGGVKVSPSVVAAPAPEGAAISAVDTRTATGIVLASFPIPLPNLKLPFAEHSCRTDRPYFTSLAGVNPRRPCDSPCNLGAATASACFGYPALDSCKRTQFKVTGGLRITVFDFKKKIKLGPGDKYFGAKPCVLALGAVA